MKTRGSIVSLLLSCAGSCLAQTYWVAPNGNDTNVGSQAAPFLTIQHAYSVALSSAAPALITLAPGTFCASNLLVVAGAQVLLQGAGVEQSVIGDAVLVTGDTRLADLTCASAFSNAASACLMHNVKLSAPPSGPGCLYGLWYDAEDYAQLSSLAEPRDGFDAVNGLWVSNHVRQMALLRSGGAMSGALYLDGAIIASSQAATKAYVDTMLDDNTNFLRTSGGTMQGNLCQTFGTKVVFKGEDPEEDPVYSYIQRGTMGTPNNIEFSAGAPYLFDENSFNTLGKVIVAGDPTASSHVVNRGYVDATSNALIRVIIAASTNASNYVRKAGDTMTGMLTVEGATLVTGLLNASGGVTITGELSCVVGSGQSFKVKNESGAAAFSFKNEGQGVEYVMHADGWGQGVFCVRGLNMPHALVAKNGAVGINGAEPDWDASETRIGGDDCYVNALHISGAAYVDAGSGEKQLADVDSCVLRTGAAMSGTLTLAGPPSAANDAATKGYVDTATNGCITSCVRRVGDTMSGELVFSNVYGDGVRFLYGGNEHKMATDGGNFMQISRLGSTNNGAGYWWRLSSPSDNGGNLYDVLWLTRRPEYTNYLHNTALRLFHPLIMDSQRIVEVGTPQSGSDAATKAYVDAVATAVSTTGDWHVGTTGSARDIIMENDGGFVRTATGAGINLRLKADQNNGGQIVLHSPVSMPGKAGKVLNVVTINGYTVQNSNCRAESIVVITPIAAAAAPPLYAVSTQAGSFTVQSYAVTGNNGQQQWSFNYLIINP